MNFEGEAQSVEKLLKNKTVEKIFRHSQNQLCIEFTDGSRLFVDKIENGLEFSVTEGKGKE